MAAIPPVVCLLLYRDALTAWFQQDDFVWLSLDPRGFTEIRRTLFLPTPHGTLRPWGDRGFFLAMKALFGLHPLAFHLVIFIVQFTNLALLGSLVRRLTRSGVAAVLAPVLWVVNPVLVLPMVWISGVYQILGCCCFLLALRLFVAYGDTGRRSFLFWQWCVFIFGLGVIESIVMYPFMAAVYALFLARHLVKPALLMVIVSVAFVLARLVLVPGHATGPYALHIDGTVALTLMRYWALAAGQSERALQRGVAAIVTAALVAFTVRRALIKDWLPVVLLAWFVLPLAPVLPLRDHVTGYYLTIPFLGLAALGAYAVIHAWRRWASRVLVVLVVVGYLMVSVQAADFATSWWTARSRRVQQTFTSVVEASRLHPNSTIVLADVDNDLFWSCVFYRPFRLAEVRDVYLAPGSEARITIPGGYPPLTDWIIPEPAIRALQNEDRVVVLRLTGAGFVDATSTWRPPPE